MIRSELIQQLAEKTKTNQRQADAFLDALTSIVTKEVQEGEKVLISGFGTFYLAHRQARNGINPVTKEKMFIDGMAMPKFRAGEKFKKAVRTKK